MSKERKYKDCNHCGKRLKKEATKCNHCGEWQSNQESKINKWIKTNIKIKWLVWLLCGIINIYFYIISDIKWIIGILFIGFATLFLGYYNLQIAGIQKDISNLTLQSNNKLSFNIKVLNEDYDNKFYIYNGENKSLDVLIKNIGDHSVKIVNNKEEGEKTEGIDLFCVPDGKTSKESLSYEVIGGNDLMKGKELKLKFNTNNISFDNSGFINISLDCYNSKNSKLLGEKPTTYGNTLSIEYKKILLQNKNILFLNTSVKPIASSLSELTSELQKNGNTFKFMTSIYQSDFKKFKTKDLSNKVTFLYKEGEYNEAIFNHIKNEIIKKEQFNYIKGYTTLELSNKVLKGFPFLGDCIGLKYSKCNPYPNYDNMEIYYNYFSSQMLDVRNSNIDYIIILPIEYKYN